MTIMIGPQPSSDQDYQRRMMLAQILQNKPRQQSSVMPTMNPSMFMNGGGNSGASGMSGGMGSLGPIAAIAAAVAATKGLEYRNPDNGVGKVMRTFNAPSLAQIQQDPKKGILGAATGLFPFLNHKMNRKAKTAKPEWESLLGM